MEEKDYMYPQIIEGTYPTCYSRSRKWISQVGDASIEYLPCIFPSS